MMGSRVDGNGDEDVVGSMRPIVDVPELLIESSQASDVSDGHPKVRGELLLYLKLNVPLSSAARRESERIRPDELNLSDAPPSPVPDLCPPCLVRSLISSRSFTVVAAFPRCPAVRRSRLHENRPRARGWTYVMVPIRVDPNPKKRVLLDQNGQTADTQTDRSSPDHSARKSTRPAQPRPIAVAKFVGVWSIELRFGLQSPRQV